MSYHVDVWFNTARSLGWRFSPAQDGYIHEGHRDEDEGKSGSRPYKVAPDAEHACYWDGIETIAQAHKRLQDDYVAAESGKKAATA